MILPRRVIRAKDIQYFFGKGERMSFKMMKTMRQELNKKPYQPITISDFCDYYGVKEADVLASIQSAMELKALTNKRKTHHEDQAMEVVTLIEKDINGFPKTEPYIFSKKRV